MVGKLFKPTLLVGVVGLAFGIASYWLVHNRPPVTTTISFPKEMATGQTLAVPIYLTSRQPVNAGELYLSFPSDLVQVKEIKTTGSIFQLWVKDSPSFSNQTGQISLAGGLPTPGFQGNNGLVATIVFEGVHTGSGQL